MLVGNFSAGDTVGFGVAAQERRRSDGGTELAREPIARPV